jgi:ATP-dependent Clp protease ATP-binding subunit ClpC
MTSNIGSRQLKDFGQGVGFSTSAKKDGADDYTKGVIQSALKKAFAPEFLNRIDDVVLFNSLSKEDIFQIIDIELKHLYIRVENMGYKIQLTENAKEYIAERGYDVEYGARPLSRAIQKYLEDPMAEEIINSNMKEGDTLVVNFDKKKEEIVVKVKKGKSTPKKSEEKNSENTADFSEKETKEESGSDDK